MNRDCALILSLCAGLAACNDAHGNFPAAIELEETLVSNWEGAFVEGCHLSVYRLSARTAARLHDQGERFLAGSEPRERDAPALGPWLETPVSGSSPDAFDPLFQLGPPAYAIAGCGEENPYDRRIEDALLQPGSFYSLTENGEGLVLIAPKERIAAFLYVG